jgi:hypothetical protein
MGCGNSKEKLEDEMLDLKISRIEVQMERYNQMQLLKEKNGINVKSPDIPDYLDPKFAVNQTKRNSISTNIKEVKNNLGDRRRSKSFKTKRDSVISNSKSSKNVGADKRRPKRSKSVAIKFAKFDENDTNAKALKAKRRSIVLEKTNKA